MKIILLFISFQLSHNVFGQAKELNELLKQCALDVYLWKEHPPIALQDSKELVVPHIKSRDTLQVIKWKDIDSARILTYGSSVEILLYGKVVKYQKCKSIDKGCVKYFHRTYKARGLDDSVCIPLHILADDALPDGGVRRQFKNTLYQLNKTPVTDLRYKSEICFDCNYEKRPLDRLPSIFYNDSTSEIVFNYDSSDRKRSSRFPVKTIRNAKKVILVGFVTQIRGTFTVSAFTLFILRSGTVFQIFNKGELFNEEALKMINTIGPGDTIIFDQVIVTGPDGSKRTIQLPGFKVE